MKIILSLLASLLFPTFAYAERSYLMIPSEVEQAERLGAAANKLGLEQSSRTPRTPNEAMEKLHRIDHDLNRIIPLAKKFQQTSLLLERGIRNARNFAEKNNRIIVEWSPILEGNATLMHALYKQNNHDDIRTLVAISILDNLVHSMDMRIKSTGIAINLQLKYSKEGKMITDARNRLHHQLTHVRKSLKNIYNTARSSEEKHL